MDRRTRTPSAAETSQDDRNSTYSFGLIKARTSDNRNVTDASPAR